jgi:hypothetical protein
MYGSTTEISVPEAMTVAVTEDTLTAELSDGRTISVPLAWYPRLVHATPEERGNWALIGGGQGVHWPGLDEDISVENLLAGRVLLRPETSEPGISGDSDTSPPLDDKNDPFWGAESMV